MVLKMIRHWALLLYYACVCIIIIITTSMKLAGAVASDLDRNPAISHVFRELMESHWSGYGCGRSIIVHFDFKMLLEQNSFWSRTLEELQTSTLLEVTTAPCLWRIIYDKQCGLEQCEMRLYDWLARVLWDRWLDEVCCSTFTWWP